MKKILQALLAFLFLSMPIFAHEGSMAGAGKLKVSQTKYFDIIYGSENLATAKILYENADDVFEELAAAYGIEPYFRLPVVITSKVEEFNAYYADSPFNRIVLYDTAQIEDLAVFSQTMLSTFTHELTHALTYNIKSKTFIAVGKIFGDAVSNHYITVTSGMAEGATVAYESSKGEGRLNDSYALQMVRQAKLEDKFPKYSDVKGASDAYPRGSFYYFNGAFTDYLQKQYGMEKYAEYWYRCINGLNLTAAGAFKKTYGMKLDQAWQQFESSFEVPVVTAADPVQAGIAKDFFEEGSEGFSIKNKSGSCYTQLCSSEDGIVFLDDSCNTVYLAKDGKIKKLFNRDYIDSIRLSYDGRFLAVGYYTLASPTVKHCAAIYDLKFKKWINIGETNIANPAVVGDGTNYYFVTQVYDPQKYSICVKALTVQGRKVKVGKENLVQKYFEPEQVPSSFTDLGNGSFAFVLKKGLEYSICISDSMLSEIKEYEAPLERMKIRDLSFSNGQFLFSWATKDTLPRLGTLDLQNKNFSLSQENISGGVYTPVEYEGHVYYTAHFYKDVKLLELVQAQAQQLQQLQGNDELVQETSVVLSLTCERENPEAIPFKPFSPFSYAFEGLLIPVGGLNSSVPNLGFTYLTSLPWYASLTMLSGGYDISTKSGIFDFSYQSGTDTSLFQYIINSSFAVDKHGFKYFSGSASTSTSFDFGTISAASFSAQANATYGRTLKDNMSVYFSTLQLVAASYSNLVMTGPGTYERGGIKLTAGVVHSLEKQVNPKEEPILDLFDVEVDFAAYIPKLIPLTCIDNFTYNLPVKAKTAFFSLSNATMRLAKLEAETVLFGWDIQKAMPGISALFINDLILTAGYTSGFDYLTNKDYETDWHFVYAGKYLNQIKDGTIKYRDYYTVKVSLGFTPNIGSFANSQMRNNFYMCYHLGKKANLPEKVFEIGLEAKF